MDEAMNHTSIHIFGCGNVLFGDDGFGPAVIERLHHHHRLPGNVHAVDAGTGIGSFLFDIALSPTGISDIFIVDAVSMEGRSPGELFELDIDMIPGVKAGDFALHQFPSVSMLREIQDHTPVNVTVLAVQAGFIPDTVECGLSTEVQCAVEPACGYLLERIGGVYAK